MRYEDYLREQSSDCIHLVVEQPWSNAAGDLIDLAIDYSATAGAIDARSAPAAPEPKLWQGWSFGR
jgi:hypothetical protein